MDDLFEERLGDALRDAPVHLSLDDHRVDHVAAVVDSDLPLKVARPGFGVHFDDRHMRSDGPGKVRYVMDVTVPAGLPATALVDILAKVTGGNLSPEPYLLTIGGGPNGDSTAPVFVMYQKGIEQGSPDVASAIGVILVIGVLVISLINRRLLERD
mgnify:CR=1 FL=1